MLWEVGSRYVYPIRFISCDIPSLIADFCQWWYFIHKEELRFILYAYATLLSFCPYGGTPTSHNTNVLFIISLNLHAIVTVLLDKSQTKNLHLSANGLTVTVPKSPMGIGDFLLDVFILLTRYQVRLHFSQDMQVKRNNLSMNLLGRTKSIGILSIGFYVSVASQQDFFLILPNKLTKNLHIVSLNFFS